MRRSHGVSVQVHHDHEDWDSTKGFLGAYASFAARHYYILVTIVLTTCIAMSVFVMYGPADERCTPGATTGQMTVSQLSPCDDTAKKNLKSACCCSAFEFSLLGSSADSRQTEYFRAGCSIAHTMSTQEKPSTCCAPNFLPDHTRQVGGWRSSHLFLVSVGCVLIGSDHFLKISLMSFCCLGL